MTTFQVEPDRLNTVADSPTGAEVGQRGAARTKVKFGPAPPIMSRVEFRVLGRPEVRVAGERLDLGSPKQQTVLVALLCSTNEVISSDRLTDLVWWKPPVAAAANLRVYLAGLRRVLRVPGEPSSRLQTLRDGYRLEIRPHELDLDRFGELVGQGERALRELRRPTAADYFEQALRLWRGRALEGMAYGSGLQMKVTRLEEQRLTVAERWAELRLELGHNGDVVAELRALLTEYPFRERLWAQLMLVLCRSGRSAEALAAYAQARTVLAEELGADPGPELRRLHEQILRGDQLISPVPDEDRAVVNVRPRQLPAGPRTFLGRTAALARVEELLAGAASGRAAVVVAIDGIAGVGKSALALVAANRAAARFPDGQLYVNLQGATPGLKPLASVDVLGRFLRALGARPSAVPSDEAEAAALFRSQVAGRRVLVLLDDAASLAQVRPLLPGGAGCAALVTGRDAVTNLSEADRLHLDLLTPADAITLLGQLAGPEAMAADPHASARLAALCGHLPLALRIAGARLAGRPGWPVVALADRLEAAQHRLDELATTDVAVRASLMLSYQGLADEARRALRLLGLLRARDFPSWALAALLDTPLARADRLLDDLARVHLLEVASAGTADTRYRFHDLVRLFARERAVEEDLPAERMAALRRLIGACLALAERADLRLAADFLGLAQHRVARWSLPRTEVERLTAAPGDWFDREHAFLVAAVDEGIDIGAADLAGCLAAALTTFFQVRNHFHDWRQVQSRALVAAVEAGDDRTALKLHRGLGELDTIQDRYADAVAHFEAALEYGTARDPEYEAALAAGLGYLYRLLGQYEPSIRYFTRARRLAEETDNFNGLVYATSGIGAVHLERGRLDEAARQFDECLRLSRQAGYLPGEAQALRCLAHLDRARGDHDAAAGSYLRAMQIAEALGDRLGAAHAACWLGEMRVRQGRHAEGRVLLARCLWVYREFGNAWGEAGTLCALAVAQLARERPRVAGRRAAQAVAIWRRIGSPHWLAIGLDTLAEAYDGAGEPDAARRARDEAAELRQQRTER